MIVIKKRASDQESENMKTIATLSNKWVVVSGNLDDQRKVNETLEKDLTEQKKAYSDLTNTYSQAAADLAKTETALKASEEAVRQKDAKISELEVQNQSLDKKAADLSNDLTNLTAQISDTQRKLVATQGDKSFLEKELKRMMAEKSELERQFNDLNVVRAQLSRLKEEMVVARRLEWIRMGVYANAEKKGAERMMQGNYTSTQAKAPKPNYDLNVEVGADGSVRVIPPVTNRPAATNPPAAR
jgi:chromosome segregation ATPase